MPETTSIALLGQAARMLAEANTIQKAKELKDLALTAADFARRKGLGEEAIQYARSYALEAERRIGELLRETERHPPGPDKQDRSPAVTDLPPTLADLGLSKKESSEAQLLAELPDEVFQQVKEGKKTRARVRKERRTEQAKAALAEAQEQVDEQAKADLAKVCDLRVCTCQELFQSGIKPDAVITDPPYEAEYLPVYKELAKACVGVPLVAVMVGQTYLPEVMNALCGRLKYRWMLAYLTPGGQAVRVWTRKVNTFWKPVLLFGESDEWFGDVAQSRANDNDKRFHEWGQSESGMADLVNRLTKPGDLICDPFLGGGTTAVVSLALGRRFVGCDISQECIDATRQRVEVSACR
jgi:hypothetical protein